MMASRVLFVLCLLSASAFARSTVWVVETWGAFPSIQDAVDAAGEGDVILVKSGGGSHFTVDGKSLTIQADVGSCACISSTGIHVPATVEVRSLGPGQVVVIRGLSILSTSDAIWVHDSQGQVWIDSCTVERPWTYPDPYFGAGARIDDCASVVLVGDTLDGSKGNTDADPAPGGPGLVASQSNVYLFDCALTGGRGGAKYIHGIVTDGGDGATISGGFASFSDCTASGGDGGYEYIYCGDGGDGVRLDRGAEVHVLDSTAQAGHGGCGSAQDGVAVRLLGGATFDWSPGDAVGCTSTLAVREGDSVDFGATGPAFAPVWLAVAMTPVAQYHDPWHGPFLVAPPWGVLTGTLDAAGAASWDVPIPPGFLPPGEGLEFFSQVVALEAGHGIYLGEGTATLLLDSSF